MKHPPGGKNTNDRINKSIVADGWTGPVATTSSSVPLCRCLVFPSGGCRAINMRLRRCRATGPEDLDVAGLPSRAARRSRRDARGADRSRGRRAIATEEVVMTTHTIQRPPDRAGPGRPARRWRIVVAFVGAATLVMLLGVFVVTRSGDESGEPRPAAPTASGAPAAVGPAATPSTAPTASSRAGQPTAAAFRFLPLWPFGSAQAAVSWQEQAGTGGHQPWHLDAAATALAFSSGFLGFTNVDRAVGTSYSGDEAWVKVGHHGEDGHDAVAAEVHLARIGTGTDRPWEVVGTRDSTLSLTSPAYEATVTSPLPIYMAGRITGVDESLRLQVRSLTSTSVLGEIVGIPAGGDNEPWSGRVPFAAPAGTVLTLVVSTGGHAGPGVERFAITGARAG
jgi:hypothetical protein